jgi:CRISPR/Cas system-associated endonuclease Cas1
VAPENHYKDLMLLLSKDNDKNKIKTTGAGQIVLTSRVIISTAASFLLNQSTVHLVMFNVKFCPSGLIENRLE